MIAPMMPSRRLSILVVSAFLFAIPASRAEDAKPVIPDDVKASLKARVDAGESAGIVVGLVGPGGETYASAGVLRLGKPDPVGPDTIFEIGSITKSFTGVLLSDMVKRGEVKLDDPVRKYLPPKVTLPKEPAREITLLDLATHRSALPRLPDNMSPADPDDPYVDYTEEKLYEFLETYKLTRGIGVAYEYSNLGMGLLGHALSRAAKTDYGTLVKQRITTPLGMKSTSIKVDAAAAPRVAEGYEESAGKLAPAKAWTWRDASVLMGAGALRSTARDMIRYVAANAGLFPSKLSGVLADSYVRRADGKSDEMDVGLAWHLKNTQERVIVWHNGATGGFHSYCAFDLALKTGVVVLSNSTADIDDIGLHLLDPAVALREIDKPVVVEEAKLAALDGWYDLDKAKLRVTHEGTQLFAQYSGQGRYPVFAKSNTLFAYRVVAASLEFELGADGTATQVTLHQGGSNLVAKRIPAASAPKERVEVAVDPKLLAEYAGRYKQSDNVTLEVKVRDGHLSIQMTGQAVFDAYGYSPTEFFLKKLDAQLSFKRNEKGVVDTVILHQDGVDQPLPRMR
jgi:CubicO group peptidase (beta-lactamase class C family)